MLLCQIHTYHRMHNMSKTTANITTAAMLNGIFLLSPERHSTVWSVYKTIKRYVKTRGLEDKL